MPTPSTSWSPPRTGTPTRSGTSSTTARSDPSPALGRPYAYAPTFDTDGSILYSDYVERDDGTHFNLYLDWDPRTNKGLLILKTPSDDVHGPIPGPDGRRAIMGEPGRPNVIVLPSAQGTKRKIILPAEASSFPWGQRWFAVHVGVEDNQFGVRPTDTMLLKPELRRTAPRARMGTAGLDAERHSPSRPEVRRPQPQRVGAARAPSSRMRSSHSASCPTSRSTAQPG